MSENLKARDGFWGQFFKSTPFERIFLKNSKFWPKIEGGGVKFTKEFLLNEIYKFCSKKWKGVNFTKEIPLNEISENTKILLKNSLRRIRYFCIQNSKNPDPHKEFFFFMGATLQLVENIKLIRLLISKASSY